jgi:hypothetical protein
VDDTGTGTGVAVARSPVRISTPNTGCFIGDVEPPLGQQVLDVAIAQGEAQIDPDRMLNVIADGKRWRR